MKTYDHGYEDSKDSEKSGTGGKNSARSMVLRYIESLSQEQIYRMIDTHTQSRFIKRKDDPTGREIMRRSMEQNGFTIQAKLEISTPDDAHEKQADDLANAVSENNTSKSQNILNEKPVDIQTKGEGGSLTTTPEFDQQLSATKGQGQSLDDATKEKLEQHTGTDLSDVKIHTGSTASTLSEGINAKAFTHGQDIYFKNGNYDPKSAEGEKLLSHEVAHTVQQEDGVGRMIQRQIDASKLKNLKDELDDSNVDEIKVLGLLEKLTIEEKNAVLKDDSYLELMAGAFSADDEMKKAMNTLGADLKTTLKWLVKADNASMFDDLSDATVINLVEAAPTNQIADLGTDTITLSCLKEEIGIGAYTRITNKIEDATQIRNKEELKKKIEDSKPRIHHTIAGDTYENLAAKYNVTVKELKDWNTYPDKNIPIGVDIYVSDPSTEIIELYEPAYRGYAEYVYWKLRKEKGKDINLSDEELQKAIAVLPEAFSILKSIIYTQNWIDHRDTQVGAIYESMLGDNIGNLTSDQVVAIQDARAESIKDIQTEYWLQLLPLAFAWFPLSYSAPMSPLKTRTFNLGFTGATSKIVGFGSGDAQIITYKVAKEITKGAKGAIQGHHLVEQRFLTQFGLDALEAPAIILTRTEHQAITNVLRNLMPYGAAPLAKQQIINFYKIAYRQYPTWIKAIENYWK